MNLIDTVAVDLAVTLTGLSIICLSFLCFLICIRYCRYESVVEQVMIPSDEFSNIYGNDGFEELNDVSASV